MNGWSLAEATHLLVLMYIVWKCGVT